MGNNPGEPQPGSVPEARFSSTLPLPSKVEGEKREPAFSRIRRIIVDKSRLLSNHPAPPLVEKLLARVQARRQVKPQESSKAADIVDFHRTMTEGKKIGLPERLRLLGGLFMERVKRGIGSLRAQTAIGIMASPTPIPLRA